VAEALFDVANSADISENYDDAVVKYIDVIQKLRQSDPANPYILRAKARLARMYLLQHQFDKAEPLFASLVHTERNRLNAAPELLIDLDDLSEAYLSKASNPHYGYEAIKHCIALRLDINPKHPRLPAAYRQLSEYCTSCSNCKEATVWILKGIELEKHYAPNKRGDLLHDENYLSSLYLTQKDTAKAQQAIQDCLDLYAKIGGGILLEIQLHTTLGRVYTEKGQYDQAEKEYQIALKKLDNTIKDAGSIRKNIMGFSQQNAQMRKSAKSRHH
jgi:tetratricopeptide (TPR) repeat protein